jgi:transcriptional regulator with XRE-family HTH domain
MPTPNVLLRHERQLRGWSQAHLAEQIDVPDYYISRWERGEVLPSPYYQQKLCEVFGRTAEELGMLQTTPLTLPVDPPMVEQLPFPQPQVHPTLLAQTLKQPRSKRKGTSPVLQVLVILVLFSAGLGTILFSRSSPMPVSSVVGHLYFLGSDQISVNSNQGIADEVRIELQSLQSPSDGKSYYAWLLPDENNQENPVVPLGKVVISAGTGNVSYNDPQHMNLLAVTSNLLITEQDSAVPPLSYSTDTSDWRYLAKIPQQPNPNDIPHHYSLLDHLRHLLAKDPTLEEHGLPGGIAIWLYRNTQQIYLWSINAVDNWQSEGITNVILLRQDIIRLLDYLDGIAYVQQDVPASTPVLVDPRWGTFGLLQFHPLQLLQGYLQHLSFHLSGLAHSPGANNLMREQAAQILAAANIVNGWFEQIRQDSRQLAAMKDEQLQKQQTLTLLNDIAKNANFALNGEHDLVTGNIQMGVERIYEAIQSLATMDITPFRE